MSDADKYLEATELYKSGNFEKSRQMFLELYNHASSERVKVLAAVSLLACLNSVQDHESLLQVTESGALLARKLQMKSEEALLKSRRAATLLQKLIALAHKMKCIKLSPEWTAFSLERDQKEYLALEERVRQVRTEADCLFKEAKDLVPDDKQAAYHLLMDEAKAKDDGLGADLLTFVKAPMWFKQFRRLSFCSPEKKREFLVGLGEVKNLYMGAARLALESGDATGPAYCHYQLAITYRSFLMFWRARWHIAKAYKIAKRLGIKRILEGIEKVREDFTAKKISGEPVNYQGLNQ